MNGNTHVEVVQPKSVVVDRFNEPVAIDTTGLATEAKQDSIITAIQAIPGGGGVQYTEGDTDATITGTALMWEDAGNALVVASTAKPLPVSASIDTTGLATSVKQDTIIGHVDGIEGLLTTIDADTGTLAGAVTAGKVQTEVTNTVAVSGTVTAVAQPGVDIGDVTINNASIPVTDNAGSLTVDAPVGTPVFVRLSDGASAITTLPVSLASVPSHAVTNAGTFAVQSTNQANSGVDIGDVTINNAAGAAAVNIQDGGNTITVDGTVNSAQSGTWTVQPGNTANTTAWLVSNQPVTSGGLSKFHLVGAATTNATNIKASAGQVYAITAFNVAATPAYIKFHNTAGTPTAGSGVTDTFLIPGNTAGAGVVINFDKGIAFSTGIGITLVTGIADADATAIAASNVVINVYYK